MPETHAEHGEIRTEHTDVNVRGVLYVGAGLVVVGVICCLASYWTYQALQRGESRPTRFRLSEKREQLPPEPRLEQIERMKTWGEPTPPLYAEEEQRLDSYGWVNKEKQIVHIPIERAMMLLVEEKRLKAREK
jgi:hypothetical protein